MMNIKAKFFISGISLFLIFVQIFIPNAPINNTTIFLLLLGLLPWLMPMIKSLDIPGVGKIEFDELRKIQSDLEDQGLLKKKSTKKYGFEGIEDPNLALVGLRIEIEKKLRELAKKYKIPGFDQYPIYKVVKKLTATNTISAESISEFYDLISILNHAAHGAKIDNNVYNWAIEIGPKILNELDSIIKKSNQKSTDSTNNKPNN